ncbi:MAG: NfeD family protein, partial [Burkholderiales bacterium]|nr:NfeD family protein [Burkholderiales bacterium]
MDWSVSAPWWIATGVLVAAELASGTFYLLMLAIGCVAGALAALAGVEMSLQIATGAVVGAAATALLRWRRGRAARPAPADSNRDVNLDIGQVVEVTHWDEAHSARVNYRGAGWSVDYVGSAVPRPGRFEIV